MSVKQWSWPDKSPSIAQPAIVRSGLAPIPVTEQLEKYQLSVQPWFFRFAHDRLAWVTLNGPAPLKCHVGRPEIRPVNHLQSGQLEWDWCLVPDYDLDLKPWRCYIPLKDEWVREGTQGWLFRKLNPGKVFDPTCTSGKFRIHPNLKTNVRLTYRAVQFICNTVNQVYSQHMPDEVTENLPDVVWVDDEYEEETSLLAMVWNARRALLELYGWCSFTLLQASEPWRERNWDKSFIELVQGRLRFLSAPRRGCIIDPLSTQPLELLTLVRDQIPIHYQWKPRGGLGDPVVDEWSWSNITKIAACFDPYEFKCCYDFAAYTKAGGKYTNNSLDRAILGRSSALELAEEYLQHPPKRLIELPTLKEPGRGGRKAALRHFVRERVGEELTEITKQAFTRLASDEEGDVLERKHPGGDMKLLTINASPLLGLHLTDLSMFFQNIDRHAHIVISKPSPADLSPFGTHSAVDCPCASDYVTDPMSVDLSSPGLQACATSDHLQGTEDPDDTVSLGSEPEEVAMDHGPAASVATISKNTMPGPAQQVFSQCGVCVDNVEDMQDLMETYPPQQFQPLPDSTQPRNSDRTAFPTGQWRAHSPWPFSSCLSRRSPFPERSSSHHQRPHSPARRESSYRQMSRSASGRSRNRLLAQMSGNRRDSSTPRQSLSLRRQCQSRRSLSPSQRSTPLRRRSPSPRRGSPSISVLQHTRSPYHDNDHSIPPVQVQRRYPPKLQTSTHRFSPYGNNHAHLWSQHMDCHDTCSSGSNVGPIDTLSPAVLSISRRDAAIEYILSSFPESATRTRFCGPDVGTGHIVPFAIPDNTKQRGRLTVPPHTELRMRYWHLLDPIMSLSDMLVRCLFKCLPYRISFPVTAQPFPTSHHSKPMSVDDDIIDFISQRQNEKVSAQMVNDYKAQVHEVLSRPHAHQFVAYGGLLSRLVRQYAPEVYLRAFAGPSYDADRGCRQLDDDNTHYTDLITPREIQMLLGLTSNNNTFWPYPEWYEKSNRYNGEWTEANEEWFNRQANSIEFARDGCLRSGTQWQRTVHVNKPEISSDSKTLTLHLICNASSLKSVRTLLFISWE